MQILIIGMHRSGTSLAAQLLHKLGAYAGEEGDLLPATRDNRKGYLERKDVVDLNEYVLDGAGNRWYEVSDFDPSRLEPERRNRFELEARRIIAHLDARGDWLLKDPRMCVTLPLWAPFVEKPAVLFVHRDPISVALSLGKRDRFPVFLSLALWEAYTVHALQSTKDMPRLFTCFDDMTSSPLNAALRVREWLGSLGGSPVLPSETEIDALVDHKLISHKMTPGDIDRLTPPQLRLHKRLIELSGTPAGPGEPDGLPDQVSEGSLDVLRYYESVNRIEKVQRSRSESLKHLWKLIRNGRPADKPTGERQ